MATRFNSGDPFGVPSGYAGANVPSDTVLPPCGLEDVDQALFAMFDSEIRFEVSNGKSNEVKKVPVVFAAGEKWAMLKKGRALRDKTGTLILPLTTIRRIGVEQNVESDITGRGINQQTGELVIKRRLDTRDRAYQNLINKLGIVNQTNVSDDTNTLQTLRATGENAGDPDVKDGALLAPKYGDNIWEIITIPSPQFFTATYEVTFWTQYTIHMNQMIQKLLSSYLPTSNGTLRLETTKGYWFVAKVQDNQLTPEDNADDMTGEERILKYKFTIKVPGYIVASDVPGAPVPVRKFLSAPTVSFSVGGDSRETLVNGVSVKPDPYAGADDPSAGFTLDGAITPRDLSTTQAPVNTVRVIRNPFTGRDSIQYVRVINRNPKTGESTLIPDDGIGMDVIDS